MQKIIEVQGLTKSYGRVRAVRGVDFHVEKGGLFALLGPNGAGKSTIINIICTFLKPDAGSILVDGHTLGRDDNAIRHSIGVVFQDGLLDRLLTAEENLLVRGALYGLKGRVLRESVRFAAEAVGVMSFLHRPYGKLSGGQRRRCDIARALVHTPDILFLDEPTTGLDPQTRKSVWNTVLHLKRERNMTVFLTTHYMEEAAGADWVIVMDDGLIAAQGTPAKLRERYTKDRVVLACSDVEAVRAILEENGITHSRTANQLILNVDSSLEALALLEACREHLAGFEVSTGTMDDAFIAITGKEIRE